MQIGLVGKPSSGKSTFFKALTLSDVAIAPYPFTTIKPNIGVGYVKIECIEKEFNVKCNPRYGYCINGQRFVPVEVIDVAGLVPGAHLGKGLGNQFLNDLNQADALIHIVDISGSTNEKGEPVPPFTYDPLNDIKFLEEEIDLWYFGILKRNWNKISRQAEQVKFDIETLISEQMCAFKVKKEMVKNIIDKLDLNKIKPSLWKDEKILELSKELRKATKPILIACNKIDIPGSEENFERAKKEFPNYILIPCSADAELALRIAAKNNLIEYIPGDSDFTYKQKIKPEQEKALEFIRERVLKKFNSTGIQQAINSAVFDLLKYVAVFPAGTSKLMDREGRILPDCFLMPPNSTALDFAYKIHEDIGKNFLFAIDVKTKRRLGADYVLKHRDAIEIVSAAK
ncbi:MAG: redox-regulated ATPase YchF [Candidatus Aenigmatarchaeota archaeon]